MRIIKQSSTDWHALCAHVPGRKFAPHSYQVVYLRPGSDSSINLLWLLIIILSISSCRAVVSPLPSSSPNSDNPPAQSQTNPSPSCPVRLTPLPEQAIVPIPLSGPLSLPEAEVSGMAWYGDFLILLPQFPGRFTGPGREGSVFALPKDDIIAFLDGRSTDPLHPIPIPFDSSGLTDLIIGSEGFEAIAFSEERAYLTIESHSGVPMMALLSTARISPDLSQFTLDKSTLVAIPPQTLLPNYSEEAVFISGDKAITIYEVNGNSINADPVAHRFDPETHSLDTIPFPNIEFRITDATDPDASGRFWVINTFTSKDAWLSTDSDPILEKFGEGTSHARFKTVERLIELQYTQAGITQTDTPPIQLKLVDGEFLRNWEALARLDERGLLIMTDKNPKSIFAFVPIP